MGLPDLTPEQRAEALRKATEARRRRAEVKLALKKREISLSEVFKLADTDKAIGKMKITSLLESLPRVGSITAATLIEDVGIAPSRRLRGVGPLQRQELIERFG